jgi:hypothetical protein
MHAKTVNEREEEGKSNGVIRNYVKSKCPAMSGDYAGTSSEIDWDMRCIRKR